METTPSWQQLYNRHFGEVGLVIGNGPSLKDVPLEFLQKYPSFGSNRIYLRKGFTPTYYVCVNPLVLDQFAEDIEKLECLKFLGEHAHTGNHITLHSAPTPMFSYAPRSWIYEGHTVTFVSLQLAFYMGFQVVLLVGVDHKYEFTGKPNEASLATGKDPNHFDAEYFSGVVWNNPDLERSAHAYRLAQVAYERNERRIVNLTADTALDVFDKMELSEWK